MRKRFIYLGFAAAAMLMGSCQAEKLGQGTSGEVDFTISTSLPSGMTTYASNQGGINNVDADEYDLRFTMEVYDGDAMVYTKTLSVEDGFASASANFDVRLLAKSYDFVFFADFVSKDGTSFYDLTGGLDEIRMTSRVYGSDAVDSYYKKETIDLSTAGVSKSVTLKRKFGKIRLLATDVVANNPEVSDNVPAKAVVSYGQSSVPVGFDARTGEVVSGALANEEFTYEISNIKESLTLGENQSVSGYVVGFDYIIPSDEQTSYNFMITIYDESGVQIGSREVSSIPVQENKLTTVYGNFYSNEGSIGVVVDDAFENGENIEIGDVITVSPEDDLAKIIAEAEAGTTINLVEGTYNCPKGILIDKPVKLIGAADHKSVISSAKESWYTIMVSGENVAGTVIDGIEVYAGYKNNLGGASDAIALWGTGTENAPVTVRNCHIMKPAELDPDIVGYLGISATYGDFQYFVIENNTIEDANYGMFLNSVSNSVIKNNTVTNTRRGGIVIGADVEKYSCNNVEVIGNTLTDISWAGKNAIYDYALSVAGVYGENVSYGENLAVGGNTVTYHENAHADIKKVPAHGFDVVLVNTADDLKDALRSQADGQTWRINAGTYDVTEEHDIAAYGSKSSRFVVTANNINIQGIGNPVIEASADGLMQGGLPDVWQTNQGSTILVYSDNVTIDGLTVRGIDCSEAYGEPSGNKAITGSASNNLAIKNCTILPAENNQGGSIIFDGDWAGKTATIENTIVKGAVITRYMSNAGDKSVTLRNVEIDPCMNEYYYGPLSVNSKDVVNVDGELKVHIYEYMTKIEDYSVQETFDGIPASSIVVLHGNIQGPVVETDPYYTNTLKLNNAFTLTCAEGATLSGILEFNAPVILDEVDYRYEGKNTIYGNILVYSEGVVINNSSLYADFDMMDCVHPGNSGRNRSGEFGFIRPASKEGFKLVNTTVQTNAMGIFGGNLINAEISGNTFRNLDGYTSRTVWLNDAAMHNVTINGNTIYNRHMVLGGNATITGNRFLNLGENGTSGNAFYFWSEFTGTISGNEYVQVDPDQPLATGQNGVTIPEID